MEVSWRLKFETIKLFKVLTVFSVLALSVLVNRDGNGWIRDQMKSLILADTKVTMYM